MEKPVDFLDGFQPFICVFQVQLEFELLLSVAFVLRESWQSVGLPEFDAEDVIGLSSPYRRTAERSSAAKKPHIKNGETRRSFRRVSTFYLCVSSLT